MYFPAEVFNGSAAGSFHDNQPNLHFIVLTYFIAIEILILLFLLTISRHTYYRGMLFLQYFQQMGYKTHEFRKWIKKHFSDTVVAPTHLFVIPLFLVELSRSHLTITAAAIIVCVFGIFSFSWTSYLRRGKQKKPLIFTPRLTRLAVTTTVIFGFIYWFGLDSAFAARDMLPDFIILTLVWLLADMLIPVFILFAAWLMKPVENRIQEGFKRQARKKISGMKNLRIIAITGSYGKTSTKFILKTLLSERFNVCYTPGSYNTPMGICKVINNDLEPGHQILILEMGARHPGNIRELCEIARPHVAVVTNIGKAHLETFGSVKAIAATKSELVQELHKNGTAVLNSDDPLVMEMKKLRDDITVIEAGLDSGIFTIDAVAYDREGCRFRLADPEGTQATVTTRLLGEHNIRNLVLGFATGRYFGLRTETMALAASRIEPVEHRLELIPAGPVTIIDDAFNSNPVGARSAVDVLSRFTGGRRILVTPGMVELGESEKLENRKWGEYIGESGIELVLLVGKERTRPIADGLLHSGYPESQILTFDSFFSARAWLNENQQNGDVILYENDLPDVMETDR